MTMRTATMIMAMAAMAVVVPVYALADPPAVTAPTLPAPFIGAPMNDNPNNGQFGLNFDDQGRFLGVGSAPEHYDNFDLTPGRARPQASEHRRVSRRETEAANTVFAGFTQQLREVAAPAAIGVSRHR